MKATITKPIATDLQMFPASRGCLNSRENIEQVGHYYSGVAPLQTGNTVAAIKNLDRVGATAPMHHGGQSQTAPGTGLCKTGDIKATSQLQSLVTGG